jgi:hypothetical protein
MVVENVSAQVPTHLLAVHSAGSRQGILVPVHVLILATNCAHIVVPYPYSEPTVLGVAGSTLTRPVYPLCVPSPSMFPLVLKYLYTRCLDEVFEELLPRPPVVEEGSEAQPSKMYAANFEYRELLKYACRVYGVWGNVVALGVFETRLSVAIEDAWAVLVDALAISTGAQWEMVKI